MKHLKNLLMILVLTGCQTAADSNYELNRRSGLSLGQDTKKQEFRTDSKLKNKKLSLNQSAGIASSSPRLTSPTIEKVWVNSQQISEDTWLQGTWLYVQTEKSRWLPPQKKGAKK